MQEASGGGFGGGPRACTAGYSLCALYKREEVREERECRNCYLAWLVRVKIGILRRVLDLEVEWERLKLRRDGKVEDGKVEGDGLGYE